ncbi:hypothetical protein IEN85_09870 [Pelagicoccus sp. NFK12]|uniref:Uncharacterized protein n=1 Tax=Pelagicoccus enzymogenes TaxID=2773457 RepID=A0A927F7J0_9BACT|nr:hypothetical protein [Pelagicoccus enzymogenes]MBD5779799.1 hypothetical protein [Pelagicoccus enzymogenes]
MSLSRQLGKIERELEGIVGVQERQIFLLQQMMRLCGSDFSAFNLLDRDLRVVGGIAWPVTEERMRLMQVLNPVLGALLKASPVSEALRFGKPKKAVAIDSEVLHASLIYREVYQPMAMHHLGTFVYPGNGDYIVGVGISSSSQPFSKEQIRSLERLCLRFEGLICGELQAIGPILSFAKPGDWRVRVGVDLSACELNDYVTGLFASFFGDTASWLGKGMLPPELTNHIRGVFRAQEGGLIPVRGVRRCSVSRAYRGRKLNLFFEETPNGQDYLLTCAEDDEAAALLQRVSDACKALQRDSYAVYRTCVAMLDGAKSHESIVQKASLGGLKESSAKRIVSRARLVLRQVEQGHVTSLG